MLPAEIATPLVMVLNELLQTRSSTASRGRRRGERGEVVVAAHRCRKQLHVTVADNGRGLPADFDAGRAASGSGLQIVRTLATGELGGTLELRTAPSGGTEAVLVVPLTPLADLAGAGRCRGADRAGTCRAVEAKCRSCAAIGHAMRPGASDEMPGRARSSGCVDQAVRARVRALPRRLSARRSSSLIPPQTPASCPVSSAHCRHSP